MMMMIVSHTSETLAWGCLRYSQLLRSFKPNKSSKRICKEFVGQNSRTRNILHYTGKFACPGFAVTWSHCISCPTALHNNKCRASLIYGVKSLKAQEVTAIHEVTTFEGCAVFYNLTTRFIKGYWTQNSVKKGQLQ